MGFKQMDNSLGFADLALAASLKHNRSLKLMNTLNDSITAKLTDLEIERNKKISKV